MQQTLDNNRISSSHKHTHTHTCAVGVIHFKKLICLSNSDNNGTLELNWAELNHEIWTKIQTIRICVLASHHHHEIEMFCFCVIGLKLYNQYLRIFCCCCYTWKPWSLTAVKISPSFFVFFFLSQHTHTHPVQIIRLFDSLQSFWNDRWLISTAIFTINLDWYSWIENDIDRYLSLIFIIIRQSIHHSYTRLWIDANNW